MKHHNFFKPFYSFIPATYKIFAHFIDPFINVLFPPPIKIKDINNIPMYIKNIGGIISFYPYAHPKMKLVIRYLKKYHDTDTIHAILFPVIRYLLKTKWYKNSIRKHEKEWVIVMIPQSDYLQPNHLEPLARILSKYLMVKILPQRYLKKKRTNKQSLLSRKERIQNLVGAFTISDTKMIQEKNIIIFDDVWTTGASMYEIAKCLKNAGAKTVIGISIAH